MEKSKELEKCRQKSDIIRKENGVVPYAGDEQKSRISSLFDEIMTKLNSVKIPKRRSHGWLRFWSVLVVIVIGLIAGGVYWFNQQSDADEQIRVRDKAWRELTGLSKTECWFMRWKLAGAQSRVEKSQAEYTSAHQACVKVLTANGFSDADMKEPAVYGHCKARLENSRAAYLRAMMENPSGDEESLSATISAFNSDIELLEAANEHFAEYKYAQGELGKLQQLSAADWKDDFFDFIVGVAMVVFWSVFFLSFLGAFVAFAESCE